MYVERGIWQGVADGFRNLGYELTARLLEISVSGEDNPAFYATDGTYAANTIKNNKEFRKAVNDLIYSKGTKLGINTINEKSSFNFSTGGGDLGAALHRVSYSVYGERVDGVWNVNITVTDTFDFTELANPFTKAESDGGIYQYFKGVVLWTGNDVAYVDQKLDIIRPVNVTIQYHDEFK